MESYLFTQIELAYPAISNYSFAFVKDEKAVQDYIKDSKLYIIALRPESSFKVINVSLGQFVELQVIQSRRVTAEFVLDIFQSAINTDNSSTLDIEFGTYSKERKIIPKTYPINDIHGIKIWQGDDNFKAWFTPEKLLFEYSRKIIKLDKVRLYEYPFSYKILYVGQSVKQNIWDRLSGHETLQEILSKESGLESSTIPTHEISILLFHIFDSQHIKGFDSELDFENDFKISSERVYLDLEKLLVKHYNKI